LKIIEEREQRKGHCSKRESQKELSWFLFQPSTTNPPTSCMLQSQCDAKKCHGGGKILKEKREESFKSKLVIWQNSPSGTCLKD
jgi:hypothetical protein